MVTSDGHKFARRLATFIESLTDKDVIDIAQGSASFQVIREERSALSKELKSKPKIPSKTELLQVLNALHAAPDRDAGFAKLDLEIPTKAALEALARLADLPVLRRDTVDDLRQKIIEATIGYRLRSNAVQGKDAKGTPDGTTA